MECVRAVSKDIDHPFDGGKPNISQQSCSNSAYLLEIFSASTLQSFVEPWYASLEDPGRAQGETLEYLMERYAKTAYGKKFGAEGIHSISEFQSKFPICDYGSLKPYFDDIQRGISGFESIFPEPITNWVMTRGTTGKTSKVIPINQTHLTQILFAGARGIVNFALRKKPAILKRDVLNLNFPSSVHTLTVPGQSTETYGYSSGTYARLHPSLDAANLVPKQGEIDSLGSGIRRPDWEKRFELVFEKASQADVGCVIGVTPVILEFARFVRKKYHKSPKDVWKMDALFCTSVSKIQTKYAPDLRYFYGDSLPVVEMYTATEWVFAQQLDDNPYICPNYDLYLFEVSLGKGRVKLL
ncbi:MAG TPA: GH3 auxin-responsive promoter family protein, partial [Nitrososphaerales archaeon]|nr:GH3 auxin-responsive promoter family protein [Nitrososphaerales archaeon]